jgi:predicted MFS family arabinose efflux permease
VYGLALLLGCVQALDRPTAQAFLYELVGPEDLHKAASLHSITQSAARMVGPALGGTAYAVLGSAACFAINGVSFLCVILALALMHADQLFPRRSDSSVTEAGAMHGVRYVLRNPELRTPLLVSVLIGCCAFNFMITITSMVRFELHGGATAVGTAHALNAVGAVLGSLLIGSLARAPSLAVLASTCCGMALTIAVNALSPSLLVFMIWAPIFGFSVGAYQTALLTSVQRATEPAMLGRVSGLLALATVGVIPIASLIAGFLIDTVSTRAAMGLGAAACLLGALVLARPLAQRAASRQSPV